MAVFTADPWFCGWKAARPRWQNHYILLLNFSVELINIHCTETVHFQHGTCRSINASQVMYQDSPVSGDRW